MYLRLSDKIEEHLQQKALSHKKVDAFTNAVALQTGISYKPFKVKSTSKKGSTKSKLKWPSLCMKDRKHMFTHLKDLSTFILDENDARSIRKLMDDFLAIMDFVFCSRSDHVECIGLHSIDSLEDFATKVKEFSTYQLFVIVSLPHLPCLSVERLWKTIKGKDSVTPYLHGLEAHIPEFIQKSPFQSVAQFQLQGQEAKHKDQTRILMNLVDLNGNKSAIILQIEVLLQYLEQDKVQTTLSPQRGPKRSPKINAMNFLPKPN